MRYSYHSQRELFLNLRVDLGQTVPSVMPYFAQHTVLSLFLIMIFMIGTTENIWAFTTEINGQCEKISIVSELVSDTCHKSQLQTDSASYLQHSHCCDSVKDCSSHSCQHCFVPYITSDTRQRLGVSGIPVLIPDHIFRVDFIFSTPPDPPPQDYLQLSGSSPATSVTSCLRI